MNIRLISVSPPTVSEIDMYNLGRLFFIGFGGSIQYEQSLACRSIFWSSKEFILKVGCHG
jgi:hypothetical protein